MKKKYHENIAQKVKDSYSQFAGQFDQTRKRQWPEFEHFLTYTRKQSKVLDLGCGNGRFYDFLQQKDVSYLGIDHNSHLLDIARKNFPEAKFRLDDIMDLNLEEEVFDNVFCIAAFHHVPTKKMRKKVVADIHRSLKADGVFILTNWNLFQTKYISSIFKAMLKSLLTLGLKGSWNDLWIKWGSYPLKRYYHAFLPRELMSLFDQKLWDVEEFYFTRKGKRVRWFRSFNLVLILRKK